MYLSTSNKSSPCTICVKLYFYQAVVTTLFLLQKWCHYCTNANAFISVFYYQSTFCSHQEIWLWPERCYIGSFSDVMKLWTTIKFNCLGIMKACIIQQIDICTNKVIFKFILTLLKQMSVWEWHIPDDNTYTYMKQLACIICLMKTW